MSDPMMDLAARDQLLANAAQRARRYLEGTQDRLVAPTDDAVAALDQFDTPVPQQGRPLAEVLEQLDVVGSPATIASAGPRYFGFVTGGTHPAALAASWLATGWDQNSALSAMSPVAARLDSIALGWIVDLLGLPSGTGGGFVSGATMANATALAAARDRVLADHGWDSYGDGLVGAPPVTVYVGEKAHTTIAKALGLVGLGRRRVVVLASDDQGRIDASKLPVIADGPTIVCTQAGNVNTGACDPFDEIMGWGRSSGAWVHVDGAFGLWAGAARDRKDLVAGVQHSDSWATDAHKWLNVGYDSGVVLVRRPHDLAASLRADASYLPTDDVDREPMHYTPQSSQRARGVEIWAVLAALGRDGVAELVERCCVLATRLADGLSAAGLAVLNDVVLNQVLVDLGPNPHEVVSRIHADGTCWAGTTSWNNKVVLRLSVSNWSTTNDDIDASISAIVDAVAG